MIYLKYMIHHIDYISMTLIGLSCKKYMKLMLPNNMYSRAYINIARKDAFLSGIKIVKEILNGS